MQYLVMRLEKGISPKDTKSHFSFYLYYIVWKKLTYIRR